MNGLSARMVVCCLLIIGISAASIAATSSNLTFNANSILADVKAQGARTVVAALWSDNGRWNQVMANIGDGKPKWLEVAVALRPGTDAGAAETLDEAIFFALKTAPVAVLQLLKDGRFETSSVCSSNIGTDYTPTESRHFIGDRINVLSGLSDRKIIATRDQCLAGLRNALADFDSSKEQKPR